MTIKQGLERLVLLQNIIQMSKFVKFIYKCTKICYMIFGVTWV